MCVRVLCTRMRIVSGRPLRWLLGRVGVGLHLAIAHSQCRRWFALWSCFRAFFLYFFLVNRNHLYFFFRFWLFLSSSRFQDVFFR